MSWQQLPIVRLHIDPGNQRRASVDIRLRDVAAASSRSKQGAGGGADDLAARCWISGRETLVQGDRPGYRPDLALKSNVEVVDAAGECWKGCRRECDSK